MYTYSPKSKIILKFHRMIILENFVGSKIKILFLSRGVRYVFKKLSNQISFNNNNKKNKTVMGLPIEVKT